MIDTELPARPVLPARPWAGGAGSMPGTDPERALAVSLDVLAGDHVPFVPELPGRGVGADMIGRAAARLVDLPVDLQPSGWRLVDRPGRDHARARAWWREDLDVLAERADGYRGWMSVALAGPWTLAAALQRSRGEVALADAGARRDIAQSLAAGVAELLGDLARIVPGASWLLTLDEPSLPAVLRGGVPTVSGFGRLPAVEGPEVRTALADLLEAARAAGAGAAGLHCCAADAPLGLMAAAGPDVVGVDVSGALAATGVAGTGGTAVTTRWEAVAEVVEQLAGSGGRIALGLADPVAPQPPSPADAGRADATAVAEVWRRTGLPLPGLAGVGVTPACGLGGTSPAAMAPVLRRVVAAAGALAETADEG